MNCQYTNISLKRCYTSLPADMNSLFLRHTFNLGIVRLVLKFSYFFYHNNNNDNNYNRQNKSNTANLHEGFEHQT